MQKSEYINIEIGRENIDDRVAFGVLIERRAK